MSSSQSVQQAESKSGADTEQVDYYENEGLISWASRRATKEEQAKADMILQSFDHDALNRICKETRRAETQTGTLSSAELECNILNHWAMGTRNFVFEVRFKDGVRWVAKINMMCLEIDLPCHLSHTEEESNLNESSEPADDQDDVDEKEFSSADEAYEVLQDEFDTMLFVQ